MPLKTYQIKQVEWKCLPKWVRSDSRRVRREYITNYPDHLRHHRRLFTKRIKTNANKIRAINKFSRAESEHHFKTRFTCTNSLIYRLKSHPEKYSLRIYYCHLMYYTTTWFKTLQKMTYANIYSHKLDCWVFIRFRSISNARMIVSSLSRRLQTWIWLTSGGRFFSAPTSLPVCDRRLRFNVCLPAISWKIAQVPSAVFPF